MCAECKKEKDFSEFGKTYKKGDKSICYYKSLCKNVFMQSIRRKLWNT